MVDGFPLLTSLVLAARSSGRCVIMLLPDGRPELARLVGPLFSLATGALAVYLLIAFDPDGPDLYQFVRPTTSGSSSWGISWHLGVDGISLMLVAADRRAVPARHCWASTPSTEDKPYFGWFLFLEAAVMGTFLSLDMFLFFVCFEVSLVPLYFLIAGGATATR